MSGAKKTPHELIKEEDIRKVIAKDKGEKSALVDFTIKDFTSKGDNFTSFVTSVEVNYTRNYKTNKTSYVVKVNPCKSANFNIMVNTLFWKEISFYSHMLGLLNAELTRIDEEPLRSQSVSILKRNSARKSFTSKTSGAKIIKCLTEERV